MSGAQIQLELMSNKMRHIQLRVPFLLFSVNMKVIKQVYALKDHQVALLLRKGNKSALWSMYELKKISNDGILSDGN